MKRPLIGITTYTEPNAAGYRLPRNYVDFVRQAGAVPVLCMPGESHVDTLIERLDGFLLTGGDDIDPARYGGRLHPTIRTIDADRDAFEIELAQRLAVQPLPTLAICRGIQLLTVALGGSLVEHVPDEFGDTTIHRADPSGPVDHGVRLAPDSRLVEILGTDTCSVVSWHHQAVRQLPPSLKPVAWADDQLIEAVEHQHHPWLIGVQWHPEMSAADDRRQPRIFEALVAKAAEMRGQRKS